MYAEFSIKKAQSPLWTLRCLFMCGTIPLRNYLHSVCRSWDGGTISVDSPQNRKMSTKESKVFF